MSGFLYFFPVTQLTTLVKDDRFVRDELAKRGVLASLGDVRSVQAETSVSEIRGAGPGGKSGLLVTVLVNGDAPLRLGYFPQFQTWRENPAGSKVWVGFDNEYPPKPGDLRTRSHHPGHEVTLGDGERWEVPVLRIGSQIVPVSDALGRSSVPTDFVYDEAGKLVEVQQAAYGELWELSGVAWNHFFAREIQPQIAMEQMVDLGLKTLALNYRVGPIEQTLLRLINSANWERVVEALLDVPMLAEYLEAQKKTAYLEAPAPASVLPGAEG